MGRKYSFFVLGLMFLLLQRHAAWFRRQPRFILAALGLLFALPQVGIHAWTLHAWGNIGGPQLDAGPMFSLGGVMTGGLGLLVDRERGLLGYAPIFVIVPACGVLTWRRTWDLMVPALLLFAPMAAFAEWRAGFSPAARHVAALAPLLALPVALGLARPVITRFAIGVLVLQAAITGYVWQHPRTLWPKGLDTNQVLERIPLIGPLYERWLPSMASPGSELQGSMCLATIAAATAVVVLVARRRS